MRLILRDVRVSWRAARLTRPTLGEIVPLAILAIAVLALVAVAGPPAPELHVGWQHVGNDGTGRFPGGADADLRGGSVNTSAWVPHEMAILFRDKTHDEYWRPDGRGGWVMRAETLREYGALIDEVAIAHLDAAEATLGGLAPSDPFRIFPDLEPETLGGRWPYVEPDARGYGSRDVAAMTHLLNRIKYHGERRWDVEVLAGPYMVLRPFGHWAGMQEPNPVFLSKWYGPSSGVWPLLDQEVIWIHCYAPERAEDFTRRGQTHRQFAEATIRAQVDAVLESGANPREFWVWTWTYTAPSLEEHVGIMLGLRDVMEDHPELEFHYAAAGGWYAAKYLLDAPVEVVTRDPFRLSVDHALVGRAIVHAINETIVEAHERVFSTAAERDPAPAE